MSTVASREGELIEMAREFVNRADDLAEDLDVVMDWLLGDEYRGKLRRLIAEHDFQKGAETL